MENLLHVKLHLHIQSSRYANKEKGEMILGYSYEQIYTLMKKFRELSSVEFLIMEKLFQVDYLETTYAELAKEIGKDTSNTRKAIMKLNERGIVCIVNKYYEDEVKGNSNPMKACFIVDGWTDNLLNNN